MKGKRLFGTTEDGVEITEYIFDNGLIEAHFLDYGCIIKNLFVFGKDGKRRDVVLGYDNAEGYFSNGGYLGAVIGRVANRIKDGEFSLNGERYKIYCNDGKNSLHGGLNGFDRKMYDVRIGENEITFIGTSFDGEEGFPGGLNFEVTYTLDGSSLDIRYRATTTKDTPVCLTNHSYFNLSDEETILNHYLTINSDFITPIDRSLIPTGEVMATAGTPFDFKNGQKVGLYVDYPHNQIKRAGGYDHNFALKNYGVYEKVASLSAPDTGIVMDVYTDNFGMQVYTGNFLANEIGKNGRVHVRRSAICLETQNFPDAVNHIAFPDVILKVGQVYEKRTTFSFSVEK